MANKTMKTLTIGGNTYEIVDEAARTNIENLTADDVGALSVDMTDSETGVTPFTNADSLGGVAASDYALKADIDVVMNNVADNYVSKSGDTMDGELSVPSLSLNGTEIRDLFFPIGSNYITSTNVNPADRLGGTWELIDKEFTSQVVRNEDVFTINTTNVSSLSSAYCILGGHNITVRISIKNNVSFGEESLLLGNINFEKIGITKFPSTLYGTGESHGLHAISYFSLNNSTGEMSHADLIGSSNTATEQTINYIFACTIQSEHMLDNFCNKFYWKRTA